MYDIQQTHVVIGDGRFYKRSTNTFTSWLSVVIAMCPEPRRTITCPFTVCVNTRTSMWAVMVQTFVNICKCTSLCRATLCPYWYT